MAAWAVCLEGLFAKKGADELKASKAIKNAVKAAAQHSKQPRKALAAQLAAFLRRGDGGFRLEGGKIARAPVKKAKKKKEEEEGKQAVAPEAEAEEEPAAATVAAAGEARFRKRKRKQQYSKGNAAEQHPAEAAEQEAGAEQHKKKKKKKAGDGTEQQQRVEGEEQKQQQQLLRASKKRRSSSAAGDSGATAAAVAGGSWEDGQDWQPQWRAEEEKEEEVDVTDMRWRQSNTRKKVKSGPFSRAEKETLRQAVLDYAAVNDCSTEEFSWLYGSSRSGETKGLWKKIAVSLPHRNVKSVWAAGTRLFHEGNYQGRWTPEEDAQLLQLVSERGRKWRELGGALGRMPELCRDRWLMIRLGEDKRQGRWADDETERLRQAVQDYLAAHTAAEAGAGGGGDEDTLTLEDTQGTAAAPVLDEDGAAAFTVCRRVVLDDIDWNVISHAVGTRSNVQCLEKWYTQLSPSMVARGEWGSGDDRRLLRALYLSGAAHDYDLDWGQLVRGRTAAQARRRWRLMLKVLPDHRDLEFGELVEALVYKYTPHLKEQRQQSAAGTQHQQLQWEDEGQGE